MIRDVTYRCDECDAVLEDLDAESYADLGRRFHNDCDGYVLADVSLTVRLTSATEPPEATGADDALLDTDVVLYEPQHASKGARRDDG